MPRRRRRRSSRARAPSCASWPHGGSSRAAPRCAPTARTGGRSSSSSARTPEGRAPRRCAAVWDPGRTHGRDRSEDSMSRFDLDGKTAVVTGGTRGIGRGIAEIFLEHGANVVVNGRSEDKGQRAVKEMGGGDNVAFVAGDVMKKDDVEALIDGAHQRYGSLDILVNNAGGITGHG